MVENLGLGFLSPSSPCSTWNRGVGCKMQQKCIGYTNQCHTNYTPVSLERVVILRARIIAFHKPNGVRLYVAALLLVFMKAMDKHTFICKRFFCGGYDLY